MLAIILAAGLAAAPQAAEPRVPALTNAEACLREKVGDAVAAASTASDAADFLLTYLCAGPVDRAATWQRNTELLTTMKSMFKGLEDMDFVADEAAEEDPAEDAVAQDAMPDMFGGIDDVTVDPVTGDLVVAEDASGIMASTLRTQTNAVGQLMGDQRPVFLRELAGRLVLEARTRR